MPKKGYFDDIEKLTLDVISTARCFIQVSIYSWY